VEADEADGEGQEALMDIFASIISYTQATLSAQPTDAALDDMGDWSSSSFGHLQR
jgi:hypothetical protein